MFESLLVVVVVLSLAIAILHWKRRADRREEIMQHSISPEALHQLLTTPDKPIVIDLRVPLDFLAHTETIPGATRIAPSEIISNPNMISKDSEYVLYCTCPGEASSENVLAAAMGVGLLESETADRGYRGVEAKGIPG